MISYNDDYLELLKIICHYLREVGYVLTVKLIMTVMSMQATIYANRR